MTNNDELNRRAGPPQCCRGQAIPKVVASHTRHEEFCNQLFTKQPLSENSCSFFHSQCLFSLLLLHNHFLSLNFQKTKCCDFSVFCHTNMQKFHRVCMCMRESCRFKMQCQQKQLLSNKADPVQKGTQCPNKGENGLA